MAVALSQKLPLTQAETSEPTARPAERWFHLLLLTAAVLLGSLLQAFGPAWSRVILEQARLNSTAALIALLLAFLASVLAHELGHLFAAVFLNYQVLGATIGPFEFEWSENRGIVRRGEGHWSRCSISAAPREISNGWRGRMMIVIAAGPAASLLLLLMAAALFLRGHGVNIALNSVETWLLSFWSSCAELNFFFFVLGLVPNDRFGSARNDAALLRALWQNNADAHDMFICHQAIELSLRGIRPEDYPEPLLSELAGFQGRPYTHLMVARRMVEWAVDSGNIPLAAEWDHAALAAGARCGRPLANRALAESACFDVLFRDDLPAAAHKFAKVEFAELFPPSLAERSRAARLMACNLPHRAPAHILRAQYHLPLGNPYYNYERMLLGQLHTKALSCRRAGIPNSVNVLSV